MAKTQDKHLNIFRTKRAFKMKWKAFFIIFKGLSLSEIKQFCFGTWESDFNRDQCQFMEMTLLQKRPSKSSNMIRLKKTILSQGKELLLFKSFKYSKELKLHSAKSLWWNQVSLVSKNLISTGANTRYHI